MNDLFSSYKRFGIFGPSEAGKTTLAKKISWHLFKTEKRKSLVLDPVAKDFWGNHAQVFTKEDEFWKIIFRERNGLVIVDDASVTINRDNELNGVFTTLRHQGHKLLVIGHSAGNLLPQMREQLQRIFLFLQNRDSVEKWQTCFPGADLSDAVNLRQYEFLTVANFQPALRVKLTK
ncbi:MAG: hypothetical protein KGJ13_06975 [Patescibacteria group bacterium]|nr:hypothetical protein [Patescibacteria group bacterium]